MTYNFGQAQDPRISTLGSPRGVLSSFHMQLADGLSISQLLNPLGAGEDAPCSEVDYRASIDQSLEALVGHTVPF